MKSFKITRVSYNRTHNVWMISLDVNVKDANGKSRQAVLFRTPNMFRVDLENSNLIGITSDEDDIREVAGNLRGSVMFGEISHHKAGDSYSYVDGNGDTQTRTAETEMYRVEDGFLDFGKTEEMIRFNAIVKAEKLKNASMSVISNAFSTSAQSAETPENEEEIPAEFVEEIEGKSATKTK